MGAGVVALRDDAGLLSLPQSAHMKRWRVDDPPAAVVTLLPEVPASCRDLPNESDRVSAGLLQMSYGGWWGSLDLHRPRGQVHVSDPIVLDTFLKSFVQLVAFWTEDALALHAASVEHRGGAVVLAGPPGTGKSTAARFLVDDGGVLLNEDLTVIVGAGDEVPHVATHPVRNEISRDAGPRRVPVQAICILSQAAAHELERLSPAAAVRALAPNVACGARRPALLAAALARTIAICGAAPVHRLRLAQDPDFIHLLS
jgi:hypothetical protein